MLKVELSLRMELVTFPVLLLKEMYQRILPPLIRFVYNRALWSQLIECHNSFICLPSLTENEMMILYIGTLVTGIIIFSRSVGTFRLSV